MALLAAAALWDVRQTQSNARRQLALLRSALRRCGQTDAGQVVVYATCALSRLENDDVVAAALKEEGAASPAGSTWRCLSGRNGRGAAERGDPWGGAESIGPVEETEHGWQVLPDQGGWGPIYWSLLRRGPTCA